MQAEPVRGGIPAIQVVGGSSSNERLREVALKQLRKKRAFMTHLIVYLTVNTMLVLVWAVVLLGGWSDYIHVRLTSDQTLPTSFFWPIFPILGWGFGLVMHGYSVYRSDSFSEKQIQREMKKLG